jgi:integrase/recombinase XerD
MTTLAEHATNYLTIRRALGFKLVAEERLLNEFAAYAEAAGRVTITTEFALQWTRAATVGENQLSRRMRTVRTFARYLHAVDPACEVPSIELLPAKNYRPAPYVYGDEEITALMDAAGALRPPLRAATFRTLIGVLACTGLRVGEAIGLDRGDVDLAEGVLTVRNSKFGKSREVLLHRSAVQALLDYAQLRDRLCPT